MVHGKFQYGNGENEFENKVCTLTTKQDDPTDSLTLSRRKIAEATTDSDRRVRITT